MTITELLLPEFDQEMAGTRKILERLPDDKFGWRPHEKSFTLGKLASHLAAIPVLATFIITRQLTKPSELATTAEVLAVFDQNVAGAREAIAGATDAHWTATIEVSPGSMKTRITAVRSRVMNHMIHHRGQLGVYLRLLDVAVVGMYGPSADEK